MYEFIIRRCRSVRFRAAVAGGIRWAHAYQPSTRGSITTLGFRYTDSCSLSAAREEDLGLSLTSALGIPITPTLDVDSERLISVGREVISKCETPCTCSSGE